MNGRIGELEIEYRTSAGHALAPTLTPAIDRAIRANLGETLEQHLGVLDADRAVIVIRELRADVTVGPSDWSLDRRCLDRIGRATAQAMGQTLAAPPSDTVRRFEDQADFVSAYIIDVLQGTSDQWYYGAFRPRDGGSPAQRITAVLADHRDEAGRVLGRLARRGRLQALLALLGAGQVRELASARRPDAGPAPGVMLLADAAIDLLAGAGWPVDADQRRALRRLADGDEAPPPPAWTDRRALSAWVWQFSSRATAAMRRGGIARGERDAAVLRALLHGSLDWLDTDWLEARIDRLGDAVAAGDQPAADSAGPAALMAVASRIRDGRLRLDVGETVDVVAVRLLAAAHADADAADPIDPTVSESLERVADAWALLAADQDALRAAARALVESDTDASTPSLEPIGRGLAIVRSCGPAAVEILRAAVSAAIAAADRGIATDGAGLYLLTRALLDVRFDAMVHGAGVPLRPVLAGLAAAWLDQRAPFDAAVDCWCGADDADDRQDIERGLLVIEEQLRERLVAQKAIEESEDAGRSRPPAAEGSLAALDRIASLLVHAWQRWLPGLASASRPYLVANCLTRRARVQIDEREIRVELESAPFDVVLRMAGYLQPIEQVPWLTRRRITFHVVREPVA
jgi:hypothetical protein